MILAVAYMTVCLIPTPLGQPHSVFGGFILVYAVCLCGHTTGFVAYSWQMAMGSLMCAQIWVRAVHTKGGSGTRSLHKLTRERQKNCPSPCPARGSNPGSLGLNSDALPLSYVPRRQRSIQDQGLYRHIIISYKKVSFIFYTQFVFHRQPSSGEGYFDTARRTS